VSKRRQDPRPLHKPGQHNRTTRLCGISRTYKVNTKRDGVKHPCFSVLIAPGRVVSRCYNDETEELKLQEAIVIRSSAIFRWPYFNATDARYISLKFKSLISGCPRCGVRILVTDVGDGSPGEVLSCMMCSWRLYSPYPNEYEFLC